MKVVAQKTHDIFIINAFDIEFFHHKIVSIQKFHYNLTTIFLGEKRCGIYFSF